MERKPIIHLIDDDGQFQIAVSRLLRASGYEVQTYNSAGEFLLAPKQDRPGCILLDIQMPGPSGLDLQKALAMQPQGPTIIFLTGHGDIPASVRAMKEGAVDFLTKPVERKQLIDAIQRALEKDAQNRHIRDQMRDWRACYETLTARERQVFDGVVAGKLNKQIAAEHAIAERTVKAHRAHVMQKLKVQSVAELVHFAALSKEFAKSAMPSDNRKSTDHVDLLQPAASSDNRVINESTGSIRGAKKLEQLTTEATKLEAESTENLAQIEELIREANALRMKARSLKSSGQGREEKN